MKVYLDHAATTQVLPEVVEAMASVYTRVYGNPSSMHSMGLEAEKVLKSCKKTFSKIIHSQDSELVFTSGGTEANNLAIQGVLKQAPPKMNHLITTAIEHPSVLSVFQHMESQGYEVTYLPVDSQGHIDPKALEGALRPTTALVSIMYVNNEIGTILDIEAYSKIIKRHSKAIFHVDGIQALGKVECHVRKLGVDLMSFSGHKIHGPKGIGCLFVKKGTPLKPMFYGGAQEKALRPGTENLAGIVGFVNAASLYMDKALEGPSHLAGIRQYMIDQLATLDGCEIISPLLGAPHILNVCFHNMRGEVLLHDLETHGVYVSTGSACASKNKSYSHVLEAIGLNDMKKEGAIRWSFSKYTSKEDIDYAMEVLSASLTKLHKIIKGR